MKICPKCDQEMEHQEWQERRQIGGWFCTACDEFVEDEDDDYDDA